MKIKKSITKLKKSKNLVHKFRSTLPLALTILFSLQTDFDFRAFSLLILYSFVFEISVLCSCSMKLEWNFKFWNFTYIITFWVTGKKDSLFPTISVPKMGLIGVVTIKNSIFVISSATRILNFHVGILKFGYEKKKIFWFRIWIWCIPSITNLYILESSQEFFFVSFFFALSHTHERAETFPE